MLAIRLAWGMMQIFGFHAEWMAIMHAEIKFNNLRKHLI